MNNNYYFHEIYLAELSKEDKLRLKMSKLSKRIYNYSKHLNTKRQFNEEGD